MSGRSPRASLDRPALADNEDRLSCYLLFAGSQHTPRGGLGDLVGAFTSEVAAREAFRQLRLSQTSVSSWAQLALVDGDNGIRPLSWFGIGATPARTPATFRRLEKSIHTQEEGGVMEMATCESPAPASPEFDPTARRRLAGRIVVCLVSLVALSTITIGVVADDGRSRSVAPNPVAGDPASSPVLPSGVDDSVFTDATSGFQR